MKKLENESTHVLERFGRDKRTRVRTSSSERVERSSNPQRDAADYERSSESAPRRSYNPNFTSDNRLHGDGETQRRPYQGRDNNSDRRDNDRGERGSYSRSGSSSYGDRKPYNRDSDSRRSDSSYGSKPRFNQDGDRPRGEGRSYGDRDSKPRYNSREEGGFNREKREYTPRGEGRSYGDRDSKPRYNNREEGGFNREKREYTPRGEGRSYGDRDSKPRYNNREEGGFNREKREYTPRGEGRSYGDRDSKPRFNNNRGEGGYNRDNRDFKPRGERKSYGDRDSRGGYSKRDDRGGRSGGRGQSNFRDRSAADKEYPRFNTTNESSEIRLNRYIAQSGVCSRREADEFIRTGQVSVNGTVITELGTKVAATDTIMLNDTELKGEKRVYLVLNKPKGFVTSLDDPHADKTVMELIDGACFERVYPVGRLDKNSVGLLLFTNDGDLTKQLTHPSYQKKKIYQVTLDKALTRADMDEIAAGITLEDGEIHADEISYVKEDKKEIGVEIHSGRNRIVRRMFEHFGYSVQKLDRVYYAGLTKKNLKRGQWRFLTREEVEQLKSGRYE